jgi:hypothetical protein
MRRVRQCRVKLGGEKTAKFASLRKSFRQLTKDAGDLTPDQTNERDTVPSWCIWANFLGARPLRNGQKHIARARKNMYQVDVKLSIYRNLHYRMISQ